MSLSLMITNVPVPPTEIDEDAYVDDGLLLGALGALNLGGDFEQTSKGSLREHPATITRGDSAYWFLKGALEGMCHDPDDLSNMNDVRGLAKLLEVIDRDGAVQVTAC